MGNFTNEMWAYANKLHNLSHSILEMDNVTDKMRKDANNLHNLSHSILEGRIERRKGNGTMKYETKIETKTVTIQVETRTISLTGRDILEMMLTKGYLTNAEYTRANQPEVFVEVDNEERYIDNNGGLKIQIQIVKKTEAEETI